MQDNTNVQELLPLREHFQKSSSGKAADLFHLKSSALHAAITNYGARIVSLLVKDKNDQWIDVVVGFPTLEDYLNAEEIYHGAIIGRFANRIAKGRLSVSGTTYQLPINNGPNHLHGGPGGFHDKIWKVGDYNDQTIVMHYSAADGEEGYPGNLDVTIIYTLTGNDLSIDFKATTDKTTVLNLTNHAYFNLNGQGTETIYDHTLFIDADHFTAIDEFLIPTGEIMPVKPSPFDFTKEKKIGKDIDESHEQIRFGNGYDHNFVLNKKGEELQLAAHARGDKSDIVLEVITDQPGLQLYTGNFMKGEHRLKGGLPDNFRSAFCLETQHFPDSPNHPHFPSTLLNKDETFQSRTIFRLLKGQ